MPVFAMKICLPDKDARAIFVSSVVDKKTRTALYRAGNYVYHVKE